MKNAHPQLIAYRNITPTVAADVFIAPGAWVIGDVHIGAGSSVWFNAVLRGDVEKIRIGTGTNIQDNCVCHVTTDKYGLTVGDNVTVGHAAILHACTIHNGALIGMGAVVLDGADVGAGAMVAAGAVVTPHTKIPAGELWAGAPARKLRDLRAEDATYLAWSGPHYHTIAGHYRAAGVKHAHAAPAPLDH